MKAAPRILGSAFFLLCAAPANAADFSGTWELNGALAQSCTFILSGPVLTGTCSNPQNKGPVSGSVEGRKLALTWDAKNAAGTPLVVKLTGEWDTVNAVAGQMVNMTAPAGSNVIASGPFIAARQVVVPRMLSVTSTRGAKIEVLDWGGSGRPLFIIPGLGANAVSFGVLAQSFAAKYHVYAYTPVVSPDDRIKADLRVGEDVLTILDTLKIEKPVLMGHSAACEELGQMGSLHPDRIAGLIYLDACLYATGDMKDPKNMGTAKYPTIKAPMLALFAGHRETGPFLTKLFDSFSATHPGARIVHLPGEGHALWITNLAQMEREVTNFVDGLPR